MENDNNNGGIGSASDMGSIEGSVSADAPGGASIEASMSANNGGGISDSPQVGTLDLDPNTIGAPIAVMDSRIDDPAPTFIAAVTNADAKALGQTIMLGAAAAGAILTAGATAGPLTGVTILNAGTNLDAFAHAAADAQQSMGVPGAFVVDISHNTIVGDSGVSAAPLTPEYAPVLAWDQINPSATGGGGGGGG